MARLQAHAGLRAEVEAATKLGIPLRRWAGWEPRQDTTYQYDDEGRLRASSTVSEPLWDDDARAWVLALAEYEASKCPGCNGWLAETTDPDNERLYESEPPVRCFRCTALHARQDDYTDDPNRSAQVLWPVKLRRPHRG